jgi:DNA-binding response OmpR family regulator
MNATLLVIEDDEATRTFLADNLTADGFDVFVAGTAREALRLIEREAPDLAVVDVGLPDLSGLDLVQAVREADGFARRLDPALPIIVVSGRAGELDRLRGLRRGADDFVGKPFSYPELLERIRAVLRRTRPSGPSPMLRVGDLVIDCVARTVCLRGRTIELSPKEFGLLRTLASAPDRVFTKEELLRDVWGYRAVGATRTLDSHACRLRQKLGADGDVFVLNVWGVGYRLVEAYGAVAA